MDRIYHQRFSLASKISITIMTLLAVYLFWIKSSVDIVLGAIVVVILVFMIERVIHTKYTLTEDVLMIDGGRFFRSRSIPLGEIVKLSSMKSRYGFTHYILIEYGAGKAVSVMPEDEKAFVNEINRRMVKDD